MRLNAVPRPILQRVMGSAAKKSLRPFTVTAAEPLGANGKSDPKVTLWPSVNAIKPGSVYMLPAEQEREVSSNILKARGSSQGDHCAGTILLPTPCLAACLVSELQMTMGAVGLHRLAPQNQTHPDWEVKLPFGQSCYFPDIPM